ncbi:MAG: SIR2 family protein [Candidatus Nealsonbacteria bacterium]|nr:SIR2 family protein [Candidatus Nealsonbacteria bacterium]
MAFVGSGLSAEHYPSWTKLVNDLCERCGSPHRVNDDSHPEKFLDAAQDAKDCAENEYFSFLGETFGRPAENTTLTYRALFTLPFDSYLTVNLDPLVAFEARSECHRCSGGVKAFPSLDRGDIGNRTVHYLHGFIKEGTTPVDGTIVLARGEFDAAYHNGGNVMSFLMPTLENDPIVFMGCRLREPVMREVFGICKEHQRVRQMILRQQGERSKPPPRFILLPIPEVKGEGGEPDQERSRSEQQEEDRRFRRMDITPVWYPAPNKKHFRLRYALEELVDLKTPSTSHGWKGDSNGQ